MGYVVAASYDGGASLVRLGSLGSAGGDWWATGRGREGEEGMDVNRGSAVHMAVMIIV